MNARVKLQGSDKIAAEIDALAQERDAADDRIIELNSLWNTVLLTGDDAKAEAHEAEKARLTRAVARADLRLASLAHDLAAAQEQETAEALAQTQAAATAVVDAAISSDRIEAYYAAARSIREFLLGWGEATERARVAGVETPQERLRVIPGFNDPDYEETYRVYIDENGHDSESAWPLCQYTIGQDGKRYDAVYGKLIEERPTRQRTRQVRGEVHPMVVLPDLLKTVQLPAIRLDEEQIWPPANETVAAEPRRMIGNRYPVAKVI